MEQLLECLQSKKQLVAYLLNKYQVVRDGTLEEYLMDSVLVAVDPVTCMLLVQHLVDIARFEAHPVDSVQFEAHSVDNVQFEAHRANIVQFEAHSVDNVLSKESPVDNVLVSNRVLNRMGNRERNRMYNLVRNRMDNRELNRMGNRVQNRMACVLGKEHMVHMQLLVHTEHRYRVQSEEHQVGSDLSRQDPLDSVLVENRVESRVAHGLGEKHKAHMQILEHTEYMGVIPSVYHDYVHFLLLPSYREDVDLRLHHMYYTRLLIRLLHDGDLHHLPLLFSYHGEIHFLLSSHLYDLQGLFFHSHDDECDLLR